MSDIDQLRTLASGMSVLYVEDEAEIRAHMATILANFFAEVRTAADGSAGLAAYRERPTDLVVTDIMMPELDGLEMARRIRALDPQQKILMVSAHNEVRYFAEAIRIGVDGFVLKPVELAQLVAALIKAVSERQAWLDSRRYQSHLERQLESASAELAQRLVTDELTGLGNATRFQQDQGEEEATTALLINLDNLGQINLGYGFAIGNGVLRAFAAGLAGEKPEGARLYRLGGDELLLTLPGEALAAGQALAEGIVDTLYGRRVTLQNGISVAVTATIGIAVGRGVDVAQRARLALMEGRLRGRNRYHVLAGPSDLEQRQREVQEWIGHVREALFDNRLVAYYQPVVCNATGQVTKYECLARLIGGDGDVVYPSRFLAAARLGGYMPALTRAILTRAGEAQRITRRSLSVNISDMELRDGSLVEFLSHEVAARRIEPQRLVLEVLEGISVTGSDELLGQLLTLKEMGFALSIDDFGAEHSNFARLLDLRADYLKIDGRFIRDLHENPRSYAISRAITQLAKSLGIRVVAEFVHCEAVQQKVLELGIDYSQGYHFGVPLADLTEAERLFAAGGQGREGGEEEPPAQQ